VLTHQALFFNALNSVAAFGLTASDEVLTNIPMFHVGGLNIFTTPAISAGATVTIDPRFDPGATLAEVERSRTTLMISVPAMTRALVAHPAWAATDLGSLRCVATGSTFVAEEALRPWLDRGVAVCQVYGLTETCPIATVVPVAEAGCMAATAGRPAMHCRVRIVDPSSGSDVGEGEVGEVVVRGPNVMQGYWRNDAATREAFIDGWFRTGDAGFVDEEGFLHVVERLKDIIVVGASNVYPGDVEAVLTGCPAVAEAAVVGRPDPDLGEVPVAFVVLTPGTAVTASELRPLFVGRLAAYKHPRDVVFVDALPRTALGKVQRSVLRAWNGSRPDAIAAAGPPPVTPSPPRA
jgi:fatty-acyl-CoA synthase